MFLEIALSSLKTKTRMLSSVDALDSNFVISLSDLFFLKCMICLSV